MPGEPAHSASRPMAVAMSSGFASLALDATMKASVSRASPARTAIPSPKIL